ncbi:HET-domain-containing protein [Ophiobolus disseminans]|uniref:HET-domain-containing protein n=1 Tax=Ophiobolus disseminans TaxID=1469910 RepID=A0A6A6ZNQ3_9PLEO|nr:HET-domain-containing protein [Ophiobolus disseminans]
MLFRLCDESHSGCPTTVDSLPTRLLDVGTSRSPGLRLVETSKVLISDPRYLTLSFIWGTATNFVTLPDNLASFLVTVPEESLPKTLADAVTSTRALGMPYIWIDALCIIQGPNGDFQRKAAKMEAVFSGAYCDLAASRTSNSWAGFLGPRPQQKAVTFRSDNMKQNFYVSKCIDAFQGDIIDGGLNSRAWILQERALARRTIYFAENQV